MSICGQRTVGGVALERVYTPACFPYVLVRSRTTRGCELLGRGETLSKKLHVSLRTTCFIVNYTLTMCSLVAFILSSTFAMCSFASVPLSLPNIGYLPQYTSLGYACQVASVPAEGAVCKLCVNFCPCAVSLVTLLLRSRRGVPLTFSTIVTMIPQCRLIGETPVIQR